MLAGWAGSGRGQADSVEVVGGGQLAPSCLNPFPTYSLLVPAPTTPPHSLRVLTLYPSHTASVPALPLHPLHQLAPSLLQPGAWSMASTWPCCMNWGGVWEGVRACRGFWGRQQLLPNILANWLDDFFFWQTAPQLLSCIGISNKFAQVDFCISRYGL